MKKVLIIDTSILCVWLGVPGKETCGSGEKEWNREKVEAILQQEEKAQTTFVLPLATIIETGNHIAQATQQRFETAQKLASLMTLTAESRTPWAAFTQQAQLWDSENLKQLANEFPNFANQGLSLGDATIKRVAEYYGAFCEVEILTGDEGLKSYEPVNPPVIPRRRRRGK